MNYKKIIVIILFGVFLSNEKTANAQSATFNYTGSLQTWTVPCGVTQITITAVGAQGGNSGSGGYTGGLGAKIIGTFTVTPSQVLNVLVGEQGLLTSGSSGGGGGGSYVTDNSNNPYIIAGGGGGAGWSANGSGGNSGTAGSSGGGGAQGTGGSNGGGGGGASGYGAGGGGGLCGNGGNAAYGYNAGGIGGSGCNNGTDGVGSVCTGTYGSSFLNGGMGGSPVGYGNGSYGGYGGGGGTTWGNPCGGGGGGYSGGGGGGYNGSFGGGGGGGSYNGGTNQTNIAGTNPGNGQVAITWTPASALTNTGNIISNVSCNGGTDGKASAKVSGGGTPYTYSWAPSGGSKDTASGLSAGTYTITVKDACANSVTATVTITQPNPLVVSASVLTNVLCNGGTDGSASSTISGGTSPYTYAWTGGGTNASVSGLSAGTYMLTLTDSHGCTGSAVVDITEPVALAVTANEMTNVLCNGGSDGSASAIVNGGTSPYMYAWTPSGGSKATASGLSAGTYTLTITDSNGCSTSASTIITEPTAITVTSKSIPDDGKCTGSAWVIVSGGVSPYTYKWTGGGTTDTIKSLCKGIYCCTITDKNGCTIDSVCETIVLGIPVIGQASSIKIYPDPNNGYFSISGVTKGQVVELYNYMGEKLSSTIADNSSVMHIDISDKVTGIYLVKVENNNGTLATEKKIMKVQ